MSFKLFSVLVILAIPVTLFLLSQQHDVRQRAQVPNQPVVKSVIIDPKPINPNGVAQYSITSTVAHGGGAFEIREQEIMINHQGTNAGQYRGRVGWEITDGWKIISKSPPIACSGGGFGAIFGNNYGSQYINLISCSTVVTSIERKVTFIVTFNPNFTTPLTNNTLSGNAKDKAGRLSGWNAFETFNLISAPVPSPTRTPTPTSQICGQAFTWGRKPTTGECRLFPTTCLDEGFVADQSCAITPTTIATITPTPSVANACLLKTKGDSNCDGKVNIDDFNVWRDGFLDPQIPH